MELILFVSGIGTMVLLAMHMIDYALEATRRPLEALRGAVRNVQTAIGDDSVLLEVGEQYDRAA